MPRNIRTTLPSHRLLYLIILIPFGFNMQSSYIIFRFSLSRPSYSFKYSSQHSLHYDRHYPKQSNVERVALNWNITKCVLWHNLIFPSRTCQCAGTNYGLNCQQKVCNKTVRSSWHEKHFSIYSSTSCLQYQNKTKKEWVTNKIYIRILVKEATCFD